MYVGIIGCTHGELDSMYAAAAEVERTNGYKIDLLLCCGDFQAVRNTSDLQCLACPVKYRSLNTFYKYYSGELKAPIPTIFVGGNHEASNYMQALPFGGYVAPNVFFMGYVNVVRFGKLLIGGISGIYNKNNYYKPHLEQVPYDDSTMRSVYHHRKSDIEAICRAFQAAATPTTTTSASAHATEVPILPQLDIFLSHDWPACIPNFGDLNYLLKRKPFFRDDIKNKNLGSPPLDQVLKTIQPKYWFAAHLHCKFAALYPHHNSKVQAGQGEIEAETKVKMTKFLALDKCLPQKDFFQVIHIPDDEVNQPSHDHQVTSSHPCQIENVPEWLALVKKSYHWLSQSATTTPSFSISSLPSPTKQDVEFLKQRLRDNSMLQVTNEWFRAVQPAHQNGDAGLGTIPTVPERQPYTEKMAHVLEVPYEHLIRGLGSHPLFCQSEGVVVVKMDDIEKQAKERDEKEDMKEIGDQKDDME